MKKITALLLMIALLCATLVGCGGSSAPTEATTVPATEAPTTEPVKTFTIHAYAPEDWGNVSLWAWSSTEGDLFQAWPGENMTAAEDGWYTYDVPEWVDHVIINGLGGSLKTEEITIEPREVWISAKEGGTSQVGYEAFEIAPEGYFEFAPGYWTTFNDGRGGSFTGRVLENTMKDCYQLTVEFDITMKSGARCKEWNLVGLIGEDSYSTENLGVLYLPDGTGKVTQTFEFSTPVTFDALMLEPKIPGGYSWTLNSLQFRDFWFLPEE